MKVNTNLFGAKAPKRYQQGGAMPTEDPEMASGEAPVEGPAPEGAPANGGQEQMMAQLQQLAQELLNQLGPDACMMLAQMLVQMIQGGGAPAGPTQMARRGGRLVRC